MRLFIGIPVAAATAKDLAATVALIRFLQGGVTGLRWPTPETWHITLQFLGNTSTEQYQCVIPQLHELASPPIPIQLDAMGFFDRAGVFFVGIQPTPELFALQQSVITATSLCGFPAETRPYHPHITLARRKGENGAREFRALKTKVKSQMERMPHLSGFTADAFQLYESISSPGSSRYEVLERFPLATLRQSDAE